MSEKFFFCPKCAEKSENITNIIINSGQIKFNCKHKVSLEKYVRYIQDLAQKEKLNSSNAPLIDGPIETKMKSISDLIRAFQLFLNTHYKYPDNYMNAKSITNLGESIQEGAKFDDDMGYVIEKIKEKEEGGKQHLEDLKNKYRIFLEDTETDMRLKGKYDKDELQNGNKVSEKLKGTDIDICIGDLGFELISKIVFKNLKEINLSCNCITSVEYLDEMILPHLEHLDLSNNEIEKIKPVASLKSKHLKMILLQENKIKTLEDFNDKNVKFDELEMLRVDKNLIKKDKHFKKAIKKFGKKLIYETLDLDSFNEKYDVDLSEKETKLHLDDKKTKELLIDLFNVINFQLSIKCLYLDNNEIDNASILSNMPLYQLELLDLSLNKLTSVLFLRKLSKRCKKLKNLYLNDNKIVDLTPFKNYSNVNNNINFEKLTILTLKNNTFYDKEASDLKNNKISIKDEETREIFKTIINNYNTDFGKIGVEIKIMEEKEEKKDKDKNKKNDLIDNEPNTNTETNVNLNNNIIN